MIDSFVLDKVKTIAECIGALAAIAIPVTIARMPYKRKVSTKFSIYPNDKNPMNPKLPHEPFVQFTATNIGNAPVLLNGVGVERKIIGRKNKLLWHSLHKTSHPEHQFTNLNGDARYTGDFPYALLPTEFIAIYFSLEEIMSALVKGDIKSILMFDKAVFWTNDEKSFYRRIHKEYRKQLNEVLGRMG